MALNWGVFGRIEEESMKLTKLAAGLFAGSLALSMFAAAQAGDLADKAIGVWLRPNKGWHIEFAKCGDNLCGEVVSGDGVDKKTGESVVGVKMLYDLTKDGEDSWVGKMYNPGDGHEYKGKVKVLSENEIKMSGCLLGGLICRSEKWPRVEDAAMPEDAGDDAMGDDAMGDDAMGDDAMGDDSMGDDAMSDDSMSDHSPGDEPQE